MHDLTELEFISNERDESERLLPLLVFLREADGVVGDVRGALVEHRLRVRVTIQVLKRDKPIRFKLGHHPVIPQLILKSTSSDGRVQRERARSVLRAELFHYPSYFADQPAPLLLKGA